MQRRLREGVAAGDHRRQADGIGQRLSADLGTTMRSDGTEQVTYKGHPLYFYDDDKDSGDAYGQGSKAFGAGWYVLKPSGEKVDSDSGDKSSGSSS